MSDTSPDAPRGPRIQGYDYSLFGEVEERPVSTIRRIIADRMTASGPHAAQVTQYDLIDITDLEKRRADLAAVAEEKGVKLTLLAFIIQASIAVLRDQPEFNASLDAEGETLILKKYYNIGFAVDAPQGLLVPVIRNADQYDLFGLAERIGELGDKARAGRLAFADAEGGSFSVSSLGPIGGTGFSPIVNAPEVAILGVARAEERPVVRDGAVVVRQMLPVSLAYDHRAVDGAQGGRFLTSLCQRLAAAEI